MRGAKFLLLIVFVCFISATVSADKIVLFAMDDFQVWWLENIQENIVQVHMDNQIPVTLGVIPQGLTDPWGAGDRLSERIQRWDGNPTTEVAEHGYDHNVYLQGMSYSQQYTRIKNGDDLMKEAGVSPESFIPPFGSADANTVKALNNLGFNTLYNPVEMIPITDKNLLIIQDQILLCKNEDEGKNCVFRDYNTLKSMINSKINQYGVALVLYHMQDFNSGTDNRPVFNTNKANQIVSYTNQLKQDGYTLMTVNQYYKYLNNAEPPAETDNDNDGYSSEVDCNDNNANIWQMLSGYLDNDKDNYGAGSLKQVCSGNSLPLGYSSNNNDCNDNNANIHPGVNEVCGNRIDDNCNRQVDEGCLTIIDKDNDGYSSEVDCNDNNANIHPGATDIPCNGIDEDCSGSDDIDMNNQNCQQLCVSLIQQYFSFN